MSILGCMRGIESTIEGLESFLILLIMKLVRMISGASAIIDIDKRPTDVLIVTTSSDHDGIQ